MAAPEKRATRAIFWDIDGTLLVTGRAGMIAWERAFAAVSGGAAFPDVRPDGLTDYQIAAWLLGHGDDGALPGEAVQSAAANLVRRYEAELPEALPLRQGRVLEHAGTLLEWLRQSQSGLLSWLVTGNTHPGASAKLRHYELADYFRDPAAPEALSGAFATRVEPRASIVLDAFNRARIAIPGLLPSEALVIGDTPHDVEGAHAVGIPVLAVATNAHSADQLASHGPWQVLPVLPPPDAFATLIGTR